MRVVHERTATVELWSVRFGDLSSSAAGRGRFFGRGDQGVDPRSAAAFSPVFDYTDCFVVARSATDFAQLGWRAIATSMGSIRVRRGAPDRVRGACGENGILKPMHS